MVFRYSLHLWFVPYKHIFIITRAFSRNSSSSMKDTSSLSLNSPGLKNCIRHCNWFNKRCLMGTVRLLAGALLHPVSSFYSLCVSSLSLFLKQRLIQQVMSVCFTSLYWSITQWGRRKLVKLSVCRLTSLIFRNMEM